MPDAKPPGRPRRPRRIRLCKNQHAAVTTYFRRSWKTLRIGKQIHFCCLSCKADVWEPRLPRWLRARTWWRMTLSRRGRGGTALAAGFFLAFAVAVTVLAVAVR